MTLMKKTLLTALPCVMLNVHAVAVDDLPTANQPLPLNYDADDDYFKQFESGNNYQYVMANVDNTVQNPTVNLQTDVEFPELVYQPPIHAETLTVAEPIVETIAQVESNQDPFAIVENIVQPPMVAVEPIITNVAQVADNLPTGFEHRVAVVPTGAEGFEHRVAVQRPVIAKPITATVQTVKSTKVVEKPVIAKQTTKVEQPVVAKQQNKVEKKPVVQPQTANVAKPTGNQINRLIARAKQMIGTPYRYGGTSPQTGFDCSGFMQYVFNDMVKLPRVSADMATVGKKVSRNDLKAGDMVFFAHSGSRISHVGMYLGDGKFIHSPSTGKTVEITSMDVKYWATRYITARRVVES